MGSLFSSFYFSFFVSLSAKKKWFILYYEQRTRRLQTRTVRINFSAIKFMLYFNFFISFFAILEQSRFWSDEFVVKNSISLSDFITKNKMKCCDNVDIWTVNNFKFSTPWTPSLDLPIFLQQNRIKTSELPWLSKWRRTCNTAWRQLSTKSVHHKNMVQLNAKMKSETTLYHQRPKAFLIKIVSNVKTDNCRVKVKIPTGFMTATLRRD